MSASSEPPYEHSIPFHELWKAQLGYVSGTILAWGVVLLQLWPVLARLQTGTHIRAFGRDEGVRFTAMSFYLLALLVAVGVGMLVFAAAHIVARGFWLSRFLTDEPTPASLPASERLARGSYLVLHVFWATSLLFACFVLLSAISAPVTMFFTSSLGFPVGVGRAIAVFIVFGSVLTTWFVYWRRHISTGRSRLKHLIGRIGYRHLAIAYIALPALWLVVIALSYVADVRLERHVFSRRSDANVIAMVELGGATSEPSLADVALTARTDSGVTSSSLQLRPVGKGRYLAIVPIASLASGDYEILLTYPHVALSPSFPFIHARVMTTVGFVVVD